MIEPAVQAAPRSRRGPWRSHRSDEPFRLARVRADALACCDALQDRASRYGAYRAGPRSRCDLYASCDVAMLRTIVGEDLARTLSERQRREWCDHINSFVRHDFDGPADGSYGDTMGHPALHANGMVIGALGVLGGRQAQPVRLYTAFDRAESVGPWLTSLDWSHAWRSSPSFWGGVLCFSFSARADRRWRDAAFAWLEANLDPVTGWWRSDTEFADRHQGLGGAAHLFPLFDHHGRDFPYPERVIDSVLALQLPDGRWLHPHHRTDRIHVMHYLELDALYALVLMRTLAPHHRPDDIVEAVRLYGDLVRIYYDECAAELYALHPHRVLAAIGTFGLLQRLLPEEFVDDVTWTDIFSDRRFYRTREVERR
jgi:hypothetical protein